MKTMEFKTIKINTETKSNGWLDVIFENNCKATIRTNDYIANKEDYGNLEMLKETLALAKLIASAPEMFEMLKDVLTETKHGFLSQESRFKIDDLLTKITE